MDYDLKNLKFHDNCLFNKAMILPLLDFEKRLEAMRLIQEESNILALAQNNADISFFASSLNNVWVASGERIRFYETVTRPESD